MTNYCGLVVGWKVERPCPGGAMTPSSGPSRSLSPTQYMDTRACEHDDFFHCVFSRLSPECESRGGAMAEWLWTSARQLSSRLKVRVPLVSSTEDAPPVHQAVNEDLVHAIRESQATGLHASHSTALCTVAPDAGTGTRQKEVLCILKNNIHYTFLPFLLKSI